MWVKEKWKTRYDIIISRFLQFIKIFELLIRWCKKLNIRKAQERKHKEYRKRALQADPFYNVDALTLEEFNKLDYQQFFGENAEETNDDNNNQPTKLLKIETPLLDFEIKETEKKIIINGIDVEDYSENNSMNKPLDLPHVYKGPLQEIPNNLKTQKKEVENEGLSQLLSAYSDSDDE